MAVASKMPQMSKGRSTGSSTGHRLRSNCLRCAGERAKAVSTVTSRYHQNTLSTSFVCLTCIFGTPPAW
eukprot:3551398-Amphidinium_carterae.1